MAVSRYLSYSRAPCQLDWTDRGVGGGGQERKSGTEAGGGRGSAEWTKDFIVVC